MLVMVALTDRLAGLALALRPRASVVFPDGWGDRLTVEMFEGLPERPLPEPVEVVWERKSEHPGFRRRRGMFRSPVADVLPEEARVVPVEVTEPGRGTDRVAVSLPSWNEEGLISRRGVAQLAAARGVAVVTFEIPFYGRRRPGGGDGTPIRTVSDFALMGVGALDEAAALLAALAPDYVHRGVTGFSMGGTLAALVAARSRGPLAAGLMAAAHSPAAIYLDGALSRAVAWQALGGREARTSLCTLLSNVSTTALPPRDHHRHAVVVAGTKDGFVPPGAVGALVEHWKGAELRWEDTGHAGLRWRHSSSLVDSLVDSFDRIAPSPRADRT